ncbi:MAG: basic rane protein, partial [Gaiellaceae bacterium]|nr:basic rane protein [Gaiellaceae bacterium]
MKLALAALLVVMTAVAVALSAGATTGAAKSNAAFKAAWIYVGPHNDGGWSQAHDKGRLAVQKALGSKVVTTYKENVTEGPQTAQVIESLIRDGNKIIFATSFGYQTAMVAAAKKHPDVYFEMATG